MQAIFEHLLCTVFGEPEEDGLAPWSRGRNRCVDTQQPFRMVTARIERGVYKIIWDVNRGRTDHVVWEDITPHRILELKFDRQIRLLQLQKDTSFRGVGRGQPDSRT